MKQTDNTWVVTYDPADRKLTGVIFNGVALMTKCVVVEQYAGHPLVLKLEVFVFNDEFSFAEKKEVDAQKELA
jgi:hypothetical protein